MSVGKTSLARVASVTAQKAEVASEERVEEALAAEEVSPTEEIAEAAIKADKKFKNVQVGDDMPAFLL